MTKQKKATKDKVDITENGMVYYTGKGLSFKWERAPLQEDNQIIQWERIDAEHILIELGCEKAVVHNEKETLKWINKIIKRYIKENKVFKEAGK